MSDKRTPGLRSRLVTALASLGIAAAGLIGFGAAPAYALGAGSVCMFNAPSGANGWGHVGWLFRIGDGTSYIYGSTEFGDGQASSTWSQQGSFQQAMDAFKYSLDANGRHMHDAGYYTKFACAGTPNSSVTAAVNTANAQASNGYSLYNNNCLTKSILIFKAYDSSMNYLGNGWGVGPNWYFDHLGTSPWSGTIAL